MAGHASNNNDREKGKYALIKNNDDDFQQGLYDKPLPCFGCGIGWFSYVSFTLIYPTPKKKGKINQFMADNIFIFQILNRVRIPFDVVLCYIPLFWKLLSERSSGTCWSCCFCNCCKSPCNCSKWVK